MRATRFIAVGITVLTGTGWAVSAFPPAADATLVYTASADASGMRVSETLPGGPGSNTLIDGGGPVAQAVLTSTGTSTSFASNPYPGDVAVAFPGAMAGLVPQAPRIPDYPLYVRAAYPTNPSPPASAAPGTSLSATAQRFEAVALASTGGGGGDNGAGQFQANTRVTGAGTSVKAAATSTGRSIALGPLQIGSITSTATALFGSDGGLVRQSSLDIAAMTVAGQGVVVKNGVLVLAGSNVPLQGSPLAQTLTQSGIEVNYLTAEDTPTGLISEALVVRRAQETPRGTITVALTFGQAIASISGTVLPDAPGSVGFDDGTTAVSPPGPAGSPGPAMVMQPPAGKIAGRIAGGLPSSWSSPDPAGSGAAVPSSFDQGGAEAATEPSIAEQGAVPATVALAQPASATNDLFDIRSSYLVIAGALIMTLLARLIASRVSLPWNS